jgi:DNA-binding winged helix-turn-helix (wHTH) protein
VVQPDDDVVALDWPDRVDEARRLDRLGTPHLLLVAADAPTPDVHSCIEDWIRLPALDGDVETRVASLRQRGASHPPVVHVDEHGRLTYRGQDVFLSPLDGQLAGVLARHFREFTPVDELLALWPRAAATAALRVHMSRLRKRLAPIGLTIAARRHCGYSLTELIAPLGSQRRRSSARAADEPT